MSERVRLLIPAALLVGLLLGLLLAWQVWPVRWYDTDPSDLRQQHQIDYVVLTADSLAVTGDVNAAARRLLELTDDRVTIEEVAALVEQVAANREATGDEAAALRLRRMAQATNLPESSQNVPSGPSRRLAFTPGLLAFVLALGVFALAAGIILWLLSRGQVAAPLASQAPANVRHAASPPSARLSTAPVTPPSAADQRVWTEQMRVRIEPPARPVDELPPMEDDDLEIGDVDDETALAAPPIVPDNVYSRRDTPGARHWAGQEAERDTIGTEFEGDEEDDDLEFEDYEVGGDPLGTGVDATGADEDSLENEQAIYDMVSRSLAARHAPQTPEPPAPSSRTDSEPGTLGVFEAEYRFGDDDFDCSFSIESGDGDFLGECGLGIGEIIAAGGAQRVAAFEVWLFDKGDIRTEAKMLASAFAYDDEDTHARLSAKGDVVLAERDTTITLETLSLQVTAVVNRCEYLPDSQAPSGVFSFLNIRLTVRQVNA
jgi:type IV secretory pathway TrbD component